MDDRGLREPASGTRRSRVTAIVPAGLDPDGRRRPPAGDCQHCLRRLYYRDTWVGGCPRRVPGPDPRMGFSICPVRIRRLIWGRVPIGRSVVQHDISDPALQSPRHFRPHSNLKESSAKRF
jgi:hypothetical protein